MEKLNKKDEALQLVVSYLKRHPYIIRDNPDLLASLSIPHETSPGVASLIERQVQLLREQVKQLHGDINYLKISAEHTRFLSNEAHKLAELILAEGDPSRIFQKLSGYLKKHHGADYARLYIFSDACRGKNSNGLFYMNASATLKRMFIEIVNRKKPLCGSLQEEHIKVLFQRQVADVNSTLILPIVQPKCECLLVLGSGKHGLYGRGFELDLLVHLSAILGARLNQLIGAC